MIGLLLDSIFNGLISFTGSPVIVVLAFMTLFIGLALMFGLPFDFALLMTAPMPYAFQKLGYLEVWVSGALIVIVFGFSIYFIWNRFQNK
jgi:hypothetical protein